jgi:rhodanese-related sulfurtransferase
MQADGLPLRSYRVADFSALAGVVDDETITVLDVRQQAEFDDGHVRRAVNIPLHELRDRIDEVPTGEVWTYCGSGYRSSIAASIIDGPERTVVLIDDDYEDAGKFGLTK